MGVGQLIVVFPLKDVQALVGGDVGPLNALSVVADDAVFNFEVVDALSPSFVDHALMVVDGGGGFATAAHHRRRFDCVGASGRCSRGGGRAVGRGLNGRILCRGCSRSCRSRGRRCRDGGGGGGGGGGRGGVLVDFGIIEVGCTRRRRGGCRGRRPGLERLFEPVNGENHVVSHDIKVPCDD